MYVAFYSKQLSVKKMYSLWPSNAIEQQKNAFENSAHKMTTI